MAAQVIDITFAAPEPAAIVLTDFIGCAHISGDFGKNGSIELLVSDNGLAPFAPIGSDTTIGAVGKQATVVGLVLPAGWHLKARALINVPGLVVRVAVE